MKTKVEDIVDSCKIRFDRGDPATWKHSDFTALSREIFRNTKVSISTNTLKRIFGKISVYEHYIPQQATLQALEKYGQPGVFDHSTREIPELTAPEVARQPRLSIVNKLLLSVVAIAIIGVVILNLHRFNTDDGLKAELNFVDMEGLLPATAFFEYQAPKSKDSIFLNFGDKTEWVHIEVGKSHISHAYLYPGVFTATLQRRKDTLKTTNVYVRSDKWIGLGFRQGGELPKHYYEFLATKTGKDSLFHISNVQLQAKGIDTSGLVYTRLCNFTPVDYKGENFIFEATFKNIVDKKGIYCRSTQFQVSGMKNRIRFRLATPGCSNRITNMISEQTYVGTKVNLSKFTFDLSDWTNVKMINKNKKVTLYVNEKMIYSQSYKEAIGEIKGLFLEFEGTAYVKSCQLRADNGKILYLF